VSTGPKTKRCVQSVLSEHAALLTRSLPAVIHNEKENEHYTALLEELDHKPGKLLPAEQRLAEFLTLLIEDFEENHYSLRSATGIEALEELMESNRLKQKDLVGIIGTSSIISEVLNGKRKLPPNTFANSAGDSTSRPSILLVSSTIAPSLNPVRAIANQ
jgi:HTH-type transcriptional regulator/antitoxin HigA